MLPPSLQLTILVGVLSWLVGTGTTWYVTASYKDAHWQAIVLSQQNEANQRALAAARMAETEARGRQLYARELELKHADALDETKRVRAANVALAERLGGLRDPGRKAPCRCPVSPATAPANLPEPSGTSSQLSDEAAEFLLEFAAAADDAATYAATCREWSESLMTPIGNSDRPSSQNHAVSFP